MMTKVFEPLLGKTVEAYIYHILVKSKAREDHLDHLREAFGLVRQHRLRLNLAKCAFGVSSGNFLGFLESERNRDGPRASSGNQPNAYADNK